MNKKRILLVDDEPGFTRLLKLNLEQTQDYEVQVVNGPERSLTVARTFRPDLVLLDLVMPGMHGGAVAEQLWNDAQARAIPVVFLSAAVGQRLAPSPRGRARVYPTIAKPASLDQILRTIGEQLPPKPATAAEPSPAHPWGS